MGHGITELGKPVALCATGCGQKPINLTGGQCRGERLVGISLVILGIGYTLPTGCERNCSILARLTQLCVHERTDGGGTQIAVNFLLHFLPRSLDSSFRTESRKPV